MCIYIYYTYIYTFICIFTYDHHSYAYYVLFVARFLLFFVVFVAAVIIIHRVNNKPSRQNGFFPLARGQPVSKFPRTVKSVVHKW